MSPAPRSSSHSAKASARPADAAGTRPSTTSARTRFACASRLSHAAEPVRNIAPAVRQGGTVDLDLAEVRRGLASELRSWCAHYFTFLRRGGAVGGRVSAKSIARGVANASILAARQGGVGSGQVALGALEAADQGVQGELALAAGARHGRAKRVPLVAKLVDAVERRGVGVDRLGLQVGNETSRDDFRATQLDAPAEVLRSSHPFTLLGKTGRRSSLVRCLAGCGGGAALVIQPSPLELHAAAHSTRFADCSEQRGETGQRSVRGVTPAP